MNRIGLVFVFVVAAALLVSACGGDDDDATSFGGTTDDDVDDDSADDDSADDDSVDDDTTDDDVDDDTTDDDTADDDVDDDTTDDDSDDDADDDTGDDDTAPECVDYGSPQTGPTLDLATLSECSGLAVSRKNPGVVWAHNDSGDGPYLYAFAMDDGVYLGRLALTGGLALDWEDMATGPCGADTCLYAADIGDNLNIRPTKSVYVIPEPTVDPVIPFGDASTADWERRTFSYEGSVRPDAESVAVDAGGRIYLLSKEYGSADFYRLPEPAADATLTAELLGTFDLNYESVDERATGADINRNGTRLLVRTLQGAFEWRLEARADFADILLADRLRVPAASEPQGEAIAYDPANGGYVHASETGSTGPPLYRVDCAP